MNTDLLIQEIRNAKSDHDIEVILKKISRRPFLRREQAAEYLGISKCTLEVMACTGGGPIFMKRRKIILYDPNDLDSWVDAAKVRSTSEADVRNL
ncbi:MAG: helix-turn-helix domain-containing protein [Magnetococcales bacterium]|nr:helix-turn-helix domain-containing protein [Magnetococcales bacterium]